jgi:hypothetical protein
VNNHFKSATGCGVNGAAAGNGSAGAATSGSGHHGDREGHVRPFRKYANGRKVKYRRTIYSARIFDLVSVSPGWPGVVYIYIYIYIFIFIFIYIL